MSRVVRHAVRAVALLIGAPLTGLFAYDLVAVRPHVAGMEAILAQADGQDASPPLLIRRLIDASVESPAPSVARMAVRQFYHSRSAMAWQARTALWQILLPMHFSDEEMYGLYASQAYNGVDKGLGRLARREHGKSLGALAPIEAARIVAIVQGPSYMLRDRQRLETHAEQLMARAGYAP
ncbi:hypothetical protein [Pseudoxanthomonas japonensis]|uniref:hypothetical protein n=1 Tax=Pseudoxanthomonas japonensis TaxID=69284 RepID=UPI00374960F6